MKSHATAHERVFNEVSEKPLPGPVELKKGTVNRVQDLVDYLAVAYRKVARTEYVRHHLQLFRAPNIVLVGQKNQVAPAGHKAILKIGNKSAPWVRQQPNSGILVRLD